MKKLLLIGSLALTGLISVLVTPRRFRASPGSQGESQGRSQRGSEVREASIAWAAIARRRRTRRTPSSKKLPAISPWTIWTSTIAEKHPEEWEKVVRKVRAGMMPLPACRAPTL